MKRYLGIFVVTLCLLSLMLVNATPAAASSDPSLVHTTNGLVKGIVNSTTRQFLGIPYAAPPVGALRWHAPQPAASWSGVRDATHFGNFCPQVGSPLSGIPQPGVVGSEDCLYLNVYTPPSAKGFLPVMLWIHGGSFNSGAGSLYDPSIIAKRGNVIVITINYRLSVFGYLALPELSAQDALGTSGNYGIQDQQAALRWTQANIAQFGGNPFRVTIFGESAGGFSVCDQIASPYAAHLFQRAITESGPCASRSQTIATSQTNGTAFAKSLGCSTDIVACMNALPAQTLVFAAVVNPNKIPVSFSPNTDGVILPQSLPDALTAGNYNHVPVLEGTNLNEGTFFVFAQISASGTPTPLTTAQYEGILQARFGAVAGQVLARYPVTSTITPDLALANEFTDAVFACPAHTANQLFAKGTRTYAYEFSDPNPIELVPTPPDFALGDTHSVELTYLFQGQLGGMNFPLTPPQLKLSNQMIDYWTTFAAEGQPNGLTTPFWPRHQTSSDLFQSLTSGGNGSAPISNFASEHQCSFWASLGV